ncbi:MAG TPA: hypothetical protein VIS99_08685 [Terrimicrobiaceae bacterium]
MLNELHQVVKALEDSGTSFGSPHEALAFMGKGDALHLLLDQAAVPVSVRIIPGADASRLMRVSHTSAGSAFPGFNLPIPLRVLPRSIEGEVLRLTEQLIAALKAKATPGAQIIDLAKQLRPYTTARTHEESQVRQFARSTSELTGWLAEDMINSPDEFAVLRELVRRCQQKPLGITEFSQQTEETLWAISEPSREQAVLLCQAAFGLLAFPRLNDAPGSPSWRKEKEKADAKDSEKSIPVYLDVAGQLEGIPIAKPSFWRALNDHLNEIKPRAYKSEARRARMQSKKVTSPAVGFTDAYSGELCTIPDSFPKPKVVKLGEVRLFSNNTAEAKCFIRYGLEGSETFSMSAEHAQKMAGALEYLGSEAKLSKTCRAIPAGREGKQDLLIAYLDTEPDDDTAFADLMGGSCDDGGGETGFEPQAAAVLELLHGKLAANPELRMRLLSISVVDKANRQLSLNRDIRVAELLRAAQQWNSAQRRVSSHVSLSAWDRARKAMVFWRPPSVFPLELTALANKVWTSDAKAGVSSSFNRVLTAADAFDVFLQDTPLALAKTEMALGVLTGRLRSLFTKGGEYKTKGDFAVLGETPRRELLKSVSLLSILIQLIKPDRTMKEPTYHLGRLLACADALHMEYCRRVRNNESPSQLIGNALFTTALEQPVFAIARLAERIVPYQAWAKTYRHVPKDENDKGGWEKLLLRYIAECCAEFIEEDGGGVKRIRADELPGKMSDLDKAKLMLGYMADLRQAKPSSPPSSPVNLNTNIEHP